MLRRGWIVERLLACIDRNRRLAEAFEISITTANARVMTASVEGIRRRSARG